MKPSADGILVNRAIARRVALALIVFAAITAWLLAQHYLAKGSSAGQPIICREPFWDCGTLRQDRPETLTHTFRLENTSERAIPIVKVAPDCGCVVADNPPSEVRSGESAELTVSATVGGKPGPFAKQIAVVLGTSPLSKLALRIEADIESSSEFLVVPSKLDFGTLSDDGTADRTIKVARYDGSPIKLLRIVPQSDALKVQTIHRGGGADSVIEVTISLDGSLMKTGRPFHSSARVVTEHKGYPEVEIPVIARSSGHSVNLVSSIFVAQLEKGASQDKILVRDGSSQSPEIEGVRYEGPAPIRIGLLPAQDHTSKRSVVRITRIDGVVGSDVKVGRGTLLVRLSGRKEILRIPLITYLSD